VNKGTLPPLIGYLTFHRMKEYVVLQGSPLLGAALTVPAVTWGTLRTLGLFFAANFLLIAHVFSLNDWADFEKDSNDPNKADLDGITRGQMGVLSLALLLASAGLFLLLPDRTLILALVFAVMSFCYSSSGVRGKETPLLSSAIHVVAGSVYFLVGYGLFRPVDLRGVLCSLFFAFTFTAGHLNHEVRDYEGDVLTGTRTNAVYFGRRPVFVASQVLFGMAYASLALLALCGLFPPWSAALGLLFFVQLRWALEAWREGLGTQSVRRLQKRYRTLYVVIGLSLVIVGRLQLG